MLVFCFLHHHGLGQIFPDSLMIPQDNHLRNWTLEDSVSIYNNINLYKFNDAIVDLYYEYGFDTLRTCNYKDPENEKVILEIYEMQDGHAAYGLFTINSSGKGTKSDVVEHAMLYDYHIHFVKGNYYVKCTVSNNSPEYLEQLLEFAKYTEESIKSKGNVPELLNAFHFESITPKHQKYFRGQTGLSQFFTFGHGAIAAFQEGVHCRENEKLYFVFAYPNNFKRREWFASAKGKMKMNRKFTDFTFVEEGFTVIDKFGSYFSFKPSGRYIFVVRGYNWEEAKPIFDQMTSNLNEIQD